MSRLQIMVSIDQGTLFIHASAIRIELTHLIDLTMKLSR